VKKALKIVGSILALVVVVSCIGVRWGLTPLPKPPVGVRLEPLSPPLRTDHVTSNNAAFYYLKAAQLMANYQQSSESKSQMDSVLAGDLTGEATALNQTLADCAPALELLNKGAEVSECQMPWLEDWTEGPTDYKYWRLLARLECCEARMAQQKVGTLAALKSHVTVVKLGSDCMQGGPYIARLVGYAIESIGLEALRSDVVQGSPTISDLRGTIDRLHQLHLRSQSPEESLRYELLVSDQLTDSLVTNRASPLMVSKTTMRGLFRAAYGDFIQETAKPYWEADTASLLTKWCPLNRPIWRIVLNRPVASLFVSMSMPVLGTVPQKAARNNTEFEATILTCAIRGVMIEQGCPPDDLSELVPTFLSVVPLDPFDGKPMRYRRNGNEWILWSVGSDRNDDFAAWHEYKHIDGHHPQNTGDIYFKSSEPQDDLQSYLRTKRTKESIASKSRFSK